MARITRPRRRREHIAARLALALAASLLANGLLLWLAVLTGAFDLGRPVRVSQVALAPLSAQDWAKNRGAAAPTPSQSQATPQPPEPKPVPPPPPPPPAEGEHGVVVKLAPGPDGQRPKDSKFIADRDQTVERETVSRYAQGHDGPVAPAPQLAGKGGEQPTPEVKPEAEKPKAGGQPKAEAPKLAMIERAEEGLVREGGQGERTRKGARNGDRDVRTPAPDQLDLTPRPAGVLDVPNAGPNENGMDQGLEEGEVTALNTRKAEGAKYLNSFGDRIVAWWRNRTRQAVGERDPEMRIFFYKDRTAILLVKIDSAGQLADLRLLQSSNVDFFDMIAMESVRQAAPFPPPPHGALDRSGEFKYMQAFTAQGPQAPRGWDWRPGQ